MGVTKLPLDKELELVEGYKSGKTYKELGIEFGVGSTTARSVVVRHGVQRRVWHNTPDNRILSPDQESQVIEMYLDGNSINEIADHMKEFGTDYTIVRNTLVRYEVPLRRVGGNNKLTPDQECEVCELYKSGMSGPELTEKFGLAPNSIIALVRRHGYEVRTFKERKYSINDNFFDIINCEAKAYFFGLLYADGNVARDSPEIVISLQERDVDILYKLNNLVTNDRQITERTHSGVPHHQRQFQLKMYSHHMKRVLGSYGMVPAKSLIKKFPDVIMNSDEDVIRHFIRGYFDGNGSIGIYYRLSRSSGYSTPFTIASSHDMCNGLKQVIEMYVPVTLSIGVYDNISKVRIQNHQGVKDVLNWLYIDSEFYIDRKYKIYKDIVNETFKKKNN